MKIIINGIEVEKYKNILPLVDWQNSIYIDGTPKNFYLTDEFITDYAMLRGYMSEPRTSEATEDEIREWDHLSKMLSTFDFWESRKKVTFINNDGPYDPDEEMRKNYLADPYDIW